MNIFLVEKESEKINNIISKYLSTKSKKPKNNLLLNKISSFRFKKEICNEIDYHKTANEKYGKFLWNINLRKSKDFKGTRRAFVNLKNGNSCPFWGIVVEKCPNQKESSIQPGYNLTETEKRIYKSVGGSKKNAKYFQKMENLEHLSVSGKNLYNLEYKRELIDSKNDKILHKVFIDNGKTLSSGEVNKIFGYNTFYKNYQDKNLHNV